ncbi:glycosyltransferase, partial [mine drainage metagenome]
SITNEHRKIIEKLISDGIKIKAFGSRKIKSDYYEGFVSDERLKDILTNASGTLFLFDYEAFGLIPLESLISGTPVITEPKMGIFTEYQTCEDVHFAESYEDLLTSCKNLLNSEKTQDIRKRMHELGNQI